MSEKWTKGPWTAWRWDIMGADNSRIARVIPWDESGSRKEDAANVNLMAAAPDMYDALKKMCLNGLELGHCVKSDCHNCLTATALKKARGES
jgi:hypothetical protein